MNDTLPIDEVTRAILQSASFNEEALRTRSEMLSAGSVPDPRMAAVAPPPPSTVQDQDPSQRALGKEAIAAGRVACVVLAGGMATRFGGVVKAGVEVSAGQSFLELKVSGIRRAAGSESVPIWLMASVATRTRLEELVAGLPGDTSNIQVFTQCASLRLAPDGELFRTAEGALSVYATGHGDMPFALRDSGLLDSLSEDGVVFMSNVDNLTATLDEVLVGHHIASHKALTVEVAPKHPGDKGGAPALVDGRVQIVEGFRFPESFDQDRIDVFSTNTLYVNRAALMADFTLPFHRVQKQVEGKAVIQFERLVGELSSVLDSGYVRVSRTGETSRFNPIKTPTDLETQVHALMNTLRARGVVA